MTILREIPSDFPDQPFFQESIAKFYELKKSVMFSFKTDKIYARAITSIRHGMAENVFRISTTVAYIQACSLPGITGTPYPFNQRLVDKHENLRLIKY